MTELLYLGDGYLREADAAVVAAGEGAVVLDRTPFYPGGGGQAYYNLTAAAALIGALPPLVLALTIQRYLVQGLSFGAVKA